MPVPDAAEGVPGPEASGDAEPAELFRALFEHSSDIVTIVDPDGRVRSMSPAGRRLLGWPLGGGGRALEDILDPDDRLDAADAFAATLCGARDPEATIVLRVRGVDGTTRHLETRFRDLVHDPDIRGVVLTSRDVTDRQEAEARIALLSEVLESSHEFVVLADRAGQILYANRIARHLLQIVEGDAATDFSRFLTPDSEARVRAEIAPMFEVTNAWTGELHARTAAGAEVPLAVTVQLHPGEAEDDGLISVIAHDISELKRVQAQLEHQATHDPLTSLANRALFQELGEQAIARANRLGTTVAVLFVDLDRFKPVNDSHGHAVGDALLVQVAARLRASIRRGDIVARFGGDEFVILCEHPAGETEMRDLASRLIAGVSRPIHILRGTVQVGASVGIAIGGGSRITIDTLIRDADAALYRAKDQGRGRAVLFGAPD